MNRESCIAFLQDGGSLCVIKDGSILYESNDEKLAPLLDCIKKHKEQMHGAVVYDKLVGSAAALLFVYSGVSEVNGIVGSKEAEEILKQGGIKHSFETVVPKILNDEKSDRCPMDKKAEGLTPEKFFQVMS